MSNITTIYAERQCESTGIWYPVQMPAIACDYCKFIGDEDNCSFCNRTGVITNPPLYQTINHHTLSAVLADVRNHDRGIGCASGQYTPISKLRGLPQDVSEQIRRRCNEGIDWSYAVSVSWLTVQEVLAHQGWDEATTVEGWLSAEQFLAFKRDRRPESWNGGVWGADVRKVTNKEMEQLIAGANVAVADHAYTLCRWEESARQACGEFFELLDEHVAPLPSVARYERWHRIYDEAVSRGLDADDAVKLAEADLSWRDDPSKVRLVFWFDQP